MEQIRNLPQKTTLSNLSLALEKGDNALAIRELSQLSIQKIMNSKELYEDMSFQLDSLRRSYLYFKKTKGIDGRVKHMATLKALGNDLKRELATIPVYHSLYELRQKDEKEVTRKICLLIIKVVKFFNTTDVMSSALIEEVALRLIYKFGGLTLEDVALCFHQAQNGDMGKVYNRIDGAVIMDWLHKYEKDVQEVGQERNARMHNQSKTGVWKQGHEYRLVEPKRLKELV